MERSKPTWELKPEEYGQTLMEQNPWHSDGVVPETWAPKVERPIAKFLWKRLRANEPRRFQLVLGPRRVGKSTSLYQSGRRLVAEGVNRRRIWWLRLDHPLLMQLDLGVLMRLIIRQSNATEASPVFIFLAELTYARDWDLWLKTFYDERWPLTIAGSSSSTAAIRKRKLESCNPSSKRIAGVDCALPTIQRRMLLGRSERCGSKGRSIVGWNRIVAARPHAAGRQPAGGT